MTDQSALKALNDPRAWKLVEGMRSIARLGTYSGLGTPADLRYIEFCKKLHRASGSLLIFTRDAGMHSCGWWKNPDYNHCWHLSLSFVDPESLQPTTVHDHKIAQRWCELFFKDARRLLWCEPPFSPEGKARAVWHYRLFCDESYSIPLLPRGEVYTREFTEKGWKSWSDLHAEPQESAHT